MSIKIENLTKTYNGKEIFKNFSLTINEKKITSIMGKSGFGKTTLVRILMGLESFDSGKVEGMKTKKISAVFQEDRLCENLSPITNIMIVCEKGVSVKEIKKELEKIGLRGNLDKPVKELSGGMKRRVAIVRSVMAQSDILIMDEPFKGLDSETKGKVIEYLKNKIEGKTVIIITHDIKEAEIFKSEIINLNKERVK